MAEVDLSSTVADASTVEAKINQSSDSKTVNFVADVSTAQVAELVVITVDSKQPGCYSWDEAIAMAQKHQLKKFIAGAHRLTNMMFATCNIPPAQPGSPKVLCSPTTTW